MIGGDGDGLVAPVQHDVGVTGGDGATVGFDACRSSPGAPNERPVQLVNVPMTMCACPPPPARPVRGLRLHRETRRVWGRLVFVRPWPSGDARRRPAPLAVV